MKPQYSNMTLAISRTVKKQPFQDIDLNMNRNKKE